MTRAEHTRALDDALFAFVADWRNGGPGCDEAQFDAHARALCAHQLTYNAPYARFAETLGFDRRHLPASWREIPAVPASAFKDATLATFPIARAEAYFHTSGTTVETPGKHYLERAALYDAALAAGFDRFMLADGARLRYLNLVPNPRLRPRSSLGYMMGHVGVLRGDGAAAYFLDGDDVDVAGFSRALAGAIEANAAVCIAGTAFGFVALLDALSKTRQFVAPAGSRIMETGGFKGRTRAVERRELYARLENAFAIPYASIVAEYGMTELVSQYYDTLASRGAEVRIKAGPPWLRTLVVDARGREVAFGETGFLRHVDLGNRSSVVAIDTEDRGYSTDGGFVLLGRDADAPVRGCSLDAETLLVRAGRS